MQDESENAIGDVLTAPPLHELVKERVMRLIAAGTWSEGYVLPSETELARQLGVSFGTVRHALQNLTNEGVLMRRRRTGTVVTGRQPHHTLDRFYKYYRLHTSRDELINTGVKMHQVAFRPASEPEAAKLRIEPGSPVVFILRVRTDAGRIVMIDRAVIPHATVPGFPSDPDEVPDLLLNFLLKKYDLRVTAVREVLTAEIATAEDRKLLELPATAVPTPLLVIDEVAFNSTNTPLLTMQHRSLTDNYRYINEVR